MSLVNTWTFLLLLCVSSIVYSKSCVWLPDNHKDLSIQMLNKFYNMIPENETSDDCVTKIKPNDTRQLYNISQVESVARWVRELFEQTLQFYTKHQEKLVSNQSAWEQLQEELYHQANLLEDCISRTTVKHEKRIWNEYFSTLEEILKEQDDATCAQWIIHVNINRYLLHATKLSTIMRNRPAQ